MMPGKKKSNGQAAQDHAHMFAESAVAALNWLIRESRSLIVVSSTWRLGLNRIELQAILNRRGVVGRVLSKTASIRKPDGFGDVDRGHEIAAFKSHRWTDGRYVILDDDDDMLPGQLPYFVRTEFDAGLTMEHARKAREILTGVPA